jgi:5-methylcytosine-specific restriction endonuclease McrA
MDYFIIEVTEQDIRREKEKARELRKTQWWINRVAKGICHYCGGVFPPAGLTMDHIVPVVRGGRSARGNVVPACKECNNRKKHMLPIEWEEYLQSKVQDEKVDQE